MRPIVEKYVVLSILGLLVALLVSPRAVAQVDWPGDIAGASRRADVADRSDAADATRLPASISTHPLGSSHSSADGGVVHAVYDEPRQADSVPASQLQQPTIDFDARTAARDDSCGTVPRENNGGKTLRPKTSDAAKGRLPGGLTLLWTTGGALALVLGLFLLVAWGLRRATPGAATLLPTDAVEILGRASLGGRQQAQLIRVGRKLLLVCLTPNGAESMTEITDPDEVDELVELCQPNRHGRAFHRREQARTV
ncbi:MAG TPA: hypothetical protein DD670_15330, partial [Planctomycetaceae bacterium]|nr:hypothetical protein [Planctomycetaceae bacterium]